MELLHEELRKARQSLGLSQQALADRAGIPRNQIVRAERGENITLETLRRIVAHLPVNHLTLMDTTSFRVDMLAEPEKLFLAALQNVLGVTEALSGAIQLAMQARLAAEKARRVAPPLPAGVDPLLLLNGLERIVMEIQTLGKDAKIAS